MDDRSPVSMTPLSRDGKSLQAGMLTALGGLATNIGSLLRGPDQCKVLNNLQMLVRGVWTSRGIGWTRHRASAFNGGTAFKDFSFFIDNAGLRTLLFQCGDDVFSYTGTTETTVVGLTSLSTANAVLPCMRRSYSVVTGTSVVIFCNGDIEPRKITNLSTSGALQFNGAGWPQAFAGKTYSKPKFCEPFGTRFVYGGFPGATTAFDILISDHGNPETFTISTPLVATDGAVFTYPPELGQLMSLRSYFIDDENEVIIGGCSDGVFIIRGNTALVFSLKILTRQFGIPSNRCFVEVGNDLIYLSTEGIRRFSSLFERAVLKNDALTWIIQDLINLIDKDNWHKAHAVHHASTQEIWFWVPLAGDGGECKHAFILNYNNDASVGGNIAPIWSTRDGTTVACSINFKGVQYGGGTDGLLQVWYSGNLYDTSAINFQLTSSLISLGNPSQKASTKKFTVVTDGGAQQFRIRTNVYKRISGGDFRKQTAMPSSKQLQGSAGASTALGSWILGLSAFPSEHVKPLDFDPAANGTFFDVELVSSSTDDALDYFGVAYTLSGGSYER